MAATQYFHPSSRASLLVHLLLRALQLGATTIAGQIFCYLIWQHNFHACRFRRCSEVERKELDVPVVYILFVTLLTASFISLFISSYRHISIFIEELSGFPHYPLKLVEPAPTSETVLETDILSSPEQPAKETEKIPEDTQSPLDTTRDLHTTLRKPYYTFLTACKRLLSTHTSTHKVSFVTDFVILSVFVANFAYYSRVYIWGPVLPLCPYIPRIAGYLPSQDAWWMKLRVIQKECILSQVAWGSSLAVIIFLALLTGLEAWWVRCEVRDSRDAEAMVTAEK